MKTPAYIYNIRICLGFLGLTNYIKKIYKYKKY